MNVEMIFKIQQLMLELNSRYPVVIQYVPGHKGIEGNETADLVAKAGHNLEIYTDTPVGRNDKSRLLEDLLRNQWQEHWYNTMRISGKGNHLFKIKMKIEEWKWVSHSDRRVETAMARLRMGHVGINQHLYRFNMSDTDLCDCGSTETITHFLFQCPKFCP